MLLFPGLVLGQSIDTQFQNPTKLTDQQMDDAKAFVHEGVKERTIKEGCAKVNNCKEDDSGVLLEQLIGKAYALFGVISGGGIVPQLTKAGGAGAAKAGSAATDGASKAADGASKTAETQTDYCMMVAMGYETVGGMIQSSLQKKAENSVSQVTDLQLQSLISLKEMHKARRTTATMQSTIYGGVTACYAAMAYTGTIKLDWKYWVKVGGAAALTTLYIKKRNKHSDAMKKVQEVIDSLPKSGDCNPWTGTSCFCSEATSKEKYPMQYEEVCVLNKGDFSTPKVNVGCVALKTANVPAYDENCECKKTNTCVKSNLKGISGKIPAVANLMNSANKGFELVNSGTFEEGKFNDYNTGAAAFATKFSGNIDKTKVPTKGLTAEQKKIADALSPYMPESLAGMAAASSDGYKGGITEPSMGSAAISNLPPALKEKLSDAISVDYQQGSGSSQGASDAPEFTMPVFGQETAASNGTEVVSFAEQAVNKADVSNAPDTPIFDIISNRYRRSGWEKLNQLEK